jgi:cell division protein FtsZ
MSIELDISNDMDDLVESVAKIIVVGVGGGGCNAIDNMIDKGLVGVEFIQINTDVQALRKNKSRVRAQIGKALTGGKGSGANPEIGKLAVEENYDDLRELLAGSDMVFIAAGMGKGTGTGGSPVVARIAKEIGALVVGIVTTPFHTEATVRYNHAVNGINELRKYVDTLIVIPNDKLDRIVDHEIYFNDAYQIVDDVLCQATKGIADIIINAGRINVDFADVKTVMSGMGDAIMGIGRGIGENRATEAALAAIQSPLLDDININGAQGVLINICGNQKMKFHESQEVLRIIQNATGDNVNLIHGVVIDDNANDEITVTVVATGFKKVNENSIIDTKRVYQEPNLQFEQPPKGNTWVNKSPGGSIPLPPNKTLDRSPKGQDRN